MRLIKGAGLLFWGYGGGVSGYIETNELFVWRGDLDGSYSIDVRYYNANTGEWKTGYITMADGEKCAEAYSREYAPSTTGAGLPRFPVRRKCRIWQGTTEITSIYPGDLIISAGASSPYDCLPIESYIKGGAVYSRDNLWCDTDILEYGYSMSPTVYSNKW
ncbi:hypothetical protein CU633_01840 [Bacillus sp. V3-13]|nr:hypothetical protein CU633_01840 [Bacillus sp. V3-13]